MDLLGPLKKASGGLTNLLIAVDKFTRSIEVKPPAKIGGKQAVDFMQDIVFHFKVPNSIIINNDTQFTREKILDFCDNNNIHVDWAIVTHPRTNRQVECANGMILQGLKPYILTQEGKNVRASLHTKAGKWVDEVPSVL
jgi:MinD superfamily P-loop ATPase